MKLVYVDTLGAAWSILIQSRNHMFFFKMLVDQYVFLMVDS